MGYLNPEEGDDKEYTEGTEAETAIDPALLDSVPLPEPGAYPDVVATDAIVSRSKKGNAMIVVTLASSEPEASAKYYIVNSKGSDRYESTLAVFGLTRDQVKAAFVAGQNAAVTQLFAGRKVSATGKHDSFNGSKNFKFDDLTPPAEGAGYREFGTDPSAAAAA